MKSKKVLVSKVKIITKIDELRKNLKKERLAGKTIGLVPTMGCFHQGHLSLIRRARQECDVVVVSLYINPLQFGPQEDFKDYPRNLGRDKKLAEKEGVDYLFLPENKEMYPGKQLTFVEVKEITSKLCGQNRPGHFTGVATVCAKLFNIVRPHKAYFGEKDFQQLKVVQTMVKDLNFDLEIIAVPTVREKDGLAISSRNIYLTPTQRKAALVLSRSLNQAQRMVSEGEREAQVLKERLLETIKKNDSVTLEYLSVCDPENFEEITRVDEKALLAIAIRIGKARLIDNTILKPGTRNSGSGTRKPALNRA